MDAKFFVSQAALRRWLTRNHDQERELLIGFYRVASGRGGITYKQALDEALCHGWIDGVRRSLDADSYTIRFTPRTRRSIWSAVNLKRAQELERDGLMHPSGLEVFHGRDPARTYQQRDRELDGVLARRFKANTAAWAFFTDQPPGYRRTASWFVMSAKREETRLRRLQVLIDHSDRGERLDVMKPKVR